MLMNTTFLGDSFSIKWQSRGIALCWGEGNAFLSASNINGNKIYWKIISIST